LTVPAAIARDSATNITQPSISPIPSPLDQISRPSPVGVALLFLHILPDHAVDERPIKAGFSVDRIFAHACIAKLEDFHVPLFQVVWIC
jgi:hypothetical protein